MIVREVQFRDLTKEDQEAAGRLGVVEVESSPWCLSRNNDGALCLSHGELSGIKPVFIDFCSGKSIFKRQSLLSSKQVISKAVNFQPGSRLLDLTAGFGEDAVLFAALGFQVTAVERQPLMYLLLQDALNRFSTFDGTDEIVSERRLKFVHGDSHDYLENSEEKFECVYFDPMFPETGKSALSSGKMQILQRLTATEPELSEDFLAKALSASSDRLVIKRPLKAPELRQNPVHSYKGKTVRYDMYKA